MEIALCPSFTWKIYLPCKILRKYVKCKFLFLVMGEPNFERHKTKTIWINMNWFCEDSSGGTNTLHVLQKRKGDLVSKIVKWVLEKWKYTL